MGSKLGGNVCVWCDREVYTDAVLNLEDDWVHPGECKKLSNAFILEKEKAGK